MKNILITGGAGFIGTHLCKKLRDQGHSVRVLDIRDPESPVDGVDYRKGDVRISKDVAVSLAGIDHVFHFAAIVSVPECQKDPIGSYQTNLLGTIEVLEQVTHAHADRVPVVFASSAAVYGHQGKEGHKLSEPEVSQSPISVYGAQKLASEHALQIFRDTFQVPSLAFRFFNVCGPGQDPKSPYSGVMTLFKEKINAGEDLTIFGDGNQTRDFISVYDIVAACAKTVEVPAANLQAQSVNLGSGISITITELAEKMQSVIGKSVGISYAAEREGDVKHSCSNIAQAKSILGWSPKYSLEDVLKDWIGSST